MLAVRSSALSQPTAVSSCLPSNDSATTRLATSIVDFPNFLRSLPAEAMDRKATEICRTRLWTELNMNASSETQIEPISNCTQTNITA
jgi:hypothetical protein